MPISQKERCPVARVELSVAPLYTAEKPTSRSQMIIAPPALGMQPLLTRGAPWHPQGWVGRKHLLALHTPSFLHASGDLPSSTPKVLRQTCHRREPRFLCEARITHIVIVIARLCSLAKGALWRSNFDLNEQRHT